MYDFFDERKRFLNIKVDHITELIFYLFPKIIFLYIFYN